jgi:hypothetical protein
MLHGAGARNEATVAVSRKEHHENRPLIGRAGTPIHSASKRAVVRTDHGGIRHTFLLVDGVMKLIKPPPVVQATVDLGYPESSIIGLGIVLLACVVLYVIPKTSLLGAILLTGYLGGAVATHVRVGSPLFTHTLFPVYLGVLVWGGLFLRDPRIRMLIGL